MIMLDSLYKIFRDDDLLENKTDPAAIIGYSIKNSRGLNVYDIFENS